MPDSDKGRKIPDNLGKDLLPRQKEDVNTALHDVVIDYNLDHTKLKNDAELHGYMSLALLDRHPDWDDLIGNPGWKAGSRAYNQFYSTLKNHLYKEGKWIADRLENRKQERAKKAQKPEDSEDQSETPNQEESIPMTTRKQ